MVMAGLWVSDQMQDFSIASKLQAFSQRHYDSGQNPAITLLQILVAGGKSVTDPSKCRHLLCGSCAVLVRREQLFVASTSWPSRRQGHLVGGHALVVIMTGNTGQRSCV